MVDPMFENVDHLVAGALLIASATIALVTGHIGEGAYLGLLGGGAAPAVLKSLTKP